MTETIAAGSGGAVGARFPLRLGALDMGSNAIRYSLAQLDQPTLITELEAQRLPVRLGHDAFTTGILSPESIRAAVGVAVHFRTRLDDLGIPHYRAVATSAVRESRNGPDLIEEVRRESGIHLETITGSEEARLVWLATSTRLELDSSTWLLADLGGGSIELSLIDRGGILASESYPVGTVRVLEALAGEAGEAPELLPLMERHASSLSLPAGDEREIAGLAITGGNAEAIADLVHGPAQSPSARELSRPDLARLRDRLAGMTVRERVERLGLREDRADVILPAVVIFQRVAELARVNRIVVPAVGVKEGILRDLADDILADAEEERESDRRAIAGAIDFGRRMRFDEPHALHVRDLALSLFDQLRWLHELGRGSRRRLALAAVLHDTGQLIALRRHHKHSWYLITHSQIAGVQQDDVPVVALVARYHRRAGPKEAHAAFRKLKGRQRTEVEKLASLLRIADALDRAHQGQVRAIEVERAGGRILLSLEAEGDISAALRAVARKSALFERVFDLELEAR